MPSSRRYVKRIWRVPVDRGALEFFATLVCKLAIKHGWPVAAQWREPGRIRFVPHDWKSRDDVTLPDDLAEAVGVAVRIIARTYKVEIFEDGHGVYELEGEYIVTHGRQMRRIK